jgi:hypothetical protein
LVVIGSPTPKRIGTAGLIERAEAGEVPAAHRVAVSHAQRLDQNAAVAAAGATKDLGQPVILLRGRIERDQVATSGRAGGAVTQA